MKSHYTCELELKSLIIRIKNARIVGGTVSTQKTIPVDTRDNIAVNNKINKYIKWYKNLGDDDKSKKVKQDLKNVIIKKSENTAIDTESYNTFGVIIIEMINHILYQSKFSGYSYQDEFISDSTYKILKYLDNFDHTKISKISNQPVNAFSYITQIICNSVVFVINKMKRARENIQNEINLKLSENGVMFDYEPQRKETRVYRISNIDEIYDVLEDEDIESIIIEHSFEELEDLAELYKIQKKYKKLKIQKVEQ